jgi:hypothetical protein
MNYLVFLLQWYNWPYLAGFLLGVASLFRLAALDPAGRAVGRRLGIRRVSGRMILRVLGLSSAVVGLTVSGAVHDYWPAEQVRGFLPGLIITALVAALITRSVGRLFERHFPEIKAVGWGSPDLGGHEGRVVSREVSPDYRAGRAQVMGEDDTLHTVMCKTREGGISYGATVVLGEYDAEDGRYFVEEFGAREETPR